MSLHELIPLAELSPELRAFWHQLTSTEPSLSSPFFTLGFAEQVSKVRNDVHVLVQRDSMGNPEVIVPIHMERRGRITPVGHPFSDYQGIICRPDVSWDSREALRTCHLRLMDFRFVPMSCPSLIQFSAAHERAYQVALPFDSRTPKEDRKLRSLQKRVGQIEFDFESTRFSDLEALIEWKRCQCRKTGFSDILATEWLRKLLTNAISSQSPDLKVQLSVLRAQSEPVAVQLGLQSDKVWHCWFTAFNPEYAAYSPGLILLTRVLQHASVRGCHIFDFGAGSETYKQRWSNRSLLVSRGSIAIRFNDRLGRLVTNLPYRFSDTATYRVSRSIVRTARRFANTFTMFVNEPRQMSNG